MTLRVFVVYYDVVLEEDGEQERWLLSHRCCLSIRVFIFA